VPTSIRWREYSLEIGTNRVSKERVRWSARAQKHHAALFGISGTGKTTLLTDILRQHTVNGTGYCLIDPHGGLYDAHVEWLARKGYDKKRTIHIIDPSADQWRVGFNPLVSETGDLREISDNIDYVLEGFSQAWGGENINAMPLYQRLLSAVLFAASVKGLTLLEAMNLLPVSRSDYREYVASDLPDHIQEDAWEDIKQFNDRDFQDRFGSAFSRIYKFMKSYYIREMMGQNDEVIDFYRCMEEGDIVLINLASRKGFTPATAQTLGKLLINNMVASSLRREVDVSRPFHLIVDEAESYLSGDVPSLLRQCRKYGLHLTLSVQDLGQLIEKGESIYRGVMGGCQTKFVFGAGAEDAEVLSKYVMPRGGYNLEEAVPSMVRPTAVGVEKVLVRNRSQNWAHAEISMHSEGVSDSIGSGSTVTFSGDVLTAMYGDGGAAVGESRSFSDPTESSAEATTSASSSVDTTGTVDAVGGSEGESETYIPVYENLPTQNFSIEQQRHRHTSAIADQDAGYTIAKIMREDPQPVVTRAPVPYRKHPERVADFKQRVSISSEYTHALKKVNDTIRARFTNLKRLVEQHPYGPVYEHDSTDGEEDEDPFLQ